MENLWAQLKAITDDLDQWDPTSQMSPKDFKQLCSRFLTNLVKDLNFEGPENVSMAISAASLGNASSSSPALSSVSRRAELEAMKVPAIRKLATKIGIKQASMIRKKADLVQAILGKEKIADAPVVGERDVVDDSAVHDRERLGFAPTIITPYLHASVAHFWEQRERLYLLGKFIGVPITHKHISGNSQTTSTIECTFSSRAGGWTALRRRSSARLGGLSSTRRTLNAGRGCARFVHSHVSGSCG